MLASLREQKDLDPLAALYARLSALLHDLGHGPFSHSSEKFYGELKDPETGDPIFTALQQESPDLFAEASPSEMLTYLMLTSPSFERLWIAIVESYKEIEPKLAEVKLPTVASLILGTDCQVGSHLRAYRQIVNGPFDADKLDYLPRDGYFTGLQIVVDIERLLHTLTIYEDNGETDLAVLSSGAGVLEQVLFAKTQLFTSMYHHHKVRAAHQLLQKLLGIMRTREYRCAEHDMADPVSYMFLDDYDVLRQNHGDPDIESIVSQIKSRDLPRRALVVSYPCFDDMNDQDAFFALSAADLDAIAREVEGELGLEHGQVFFDVPDQPRLGGTGQALVRVARDKVLLLQDIYPAGAWAKAHAGYRRVAYVFTTASARRTAIAKAVRGILAGPRFDVHLNENALVLAKLD
jgi:HD superfamily phosphohydrolase